MPRSKHRKKTPKPSRPRVVPLGSSMRLAVELPPRLHRSIYAERGFPSGFVNDGTYCTGCGDDAITDVHGEPSCYWCRSMELRTPYAKEILDNLIYARRGVYQTIGRDWVCAAEASDGAAWVHPSGLSVVEGVALESNGLDVAHLADRPDVETTEFGRVAVLRSPSGHELFRTKLESDPPSKETVDLIRDMAWENARQQGWQWWHHVVLARRDGKTPSFGDVAFVRSNFITDVRECYIVMPALDEVAVLHPNVVHLWHCLEPRYGPTARVLPTFDSRVAGLQPRT